MSRAEIALRISLAAIVVFMVVQLTGHAVADVLLMPLALITDTLSETYTAQLSWAPGSRDMVQVTAQLFDGGQSLAPLDIYNGAQIKAAIHLEHMLLPVVLLYTVLGAWPQPDWRRRMVVMLAGVPGALVTLALTTPFLLAGKIEMLLLERAAAMGVPRAEPGLLRWMLFTEGGGRWLLAIVLALVIIVAIDVVMPARDVSEGTRSSRNAGRNPRHGSTRKEHTRSRR